jgi:RimJ/RimL family protein N-acetyltransferase
MRELTSLAQIVAAGHHDPLVIWTAQGMRQGVRAWAVDDAIAVACPDLANRDRLAVRGPEQAVACLVRHALAEVGPHFRPIGDAALISALPHLVPGLIVANEFSWLDTTAGWQRPSTGFPVASESWSVGPQVRWLPDTAAGEVDELLTDAYPESYARYGGPGVSRWVGARDRSDHLVAVAADAWSTAGHVGCGGVGFIMGVATAEQARRGGYARAVCDFLVAALVSGYGRAALMVDNWNTPAMRLYERLGLLVRPVATARAVTGWAQVAPTAPPS